MYYPKLRIFMPVALIGFLVIVLFSVSFAEVPELISYQGRLTDSGGNPVTNPTTVTFAIHDSPGGGSPVWTESHAVSPDAKGLFEVVLGTVNPLTDYVFSGPNRWLELQVGADPPMTPLTQLTSVGYAHRIGSIDGSSAGTVNGEVIIVGETSEKDARGSSIIKMTKLMYGNYVAEVKGTEVGEYVMDIIDDESDPDPNPENTPKFSLDVEDSDTTKPCDISIGKNDHVGINNPDPEEALDIGGEPGVDGIRFPDGTKQTTAAVPGSGWWNQPALQDYIYNTNTGNVGIGTDDPDEQLEVGGDVYIHDTLMVGTDYSGSLDGSPALLDVSNYEHDGNDYVGIHIGSWWNAELYLDRGNEDADSKIHFQNSGTSEWILYNDGSDDAIKLNKVGLGTVMDIRSDGNVGILKAPAVSYQLDVNGDIQCVSLNQTSDLRFKKNVHQLKGVLPKLDKIQGVSFEWNEKAHDYGTFKDKPQIGVVAQELEKVFPELVSSPDDGYKAVDYTKLTAVLIEAVKELKSENDNLKIRLEKLESKILK